LQRLSAITGRFNPLHGNNGGYWKDIYCWPTGIITQPELGIVAPAYPKEYFFSTGQFKGKEKNGKWFSSPKLRKMIPEAERGDWMSYLHICIRIARGVRRMHTAGLAHSDLSNKNVLVAPTTGNAIIIDIDGLVVPGVYPPDVLGTPGYIAPEVVSTQKLPLRDAKRILPSVRTDLHALAVLIYEYLLHRHPLRGPKINSMVSSEEDEWLSMGAKALFIEHSGDASNRPGKINIPYRILGPYLTELVERAFAVSLHDPDNRPSASEWEMALVKTADILMPCGDPKCEAKWFVFNDQIPIRCPFCGWTYRGVMLPLIHFYSERRRGQYSPDNYRLLVHGTQYLYQWHAIRRFADEMADHTPLGYFAFHNGQWVLVNQTHDTMMINESEPLPPNSMRVLVDGMRLRLSNDSNARLALVQMVNV
jgi:serine/threonine protein kinase